MYKIKLIIIVFFTNLSYFSFGQNDVDVSVNQDIETARYLGKDLAESLAKNAVYPPEALMKNIQGDVVISFIINKTGEIENMNIESTPNISLSTMSIIAINQLEKKWKPYKVNGKAVNKKQKIVFRYRIYHDTKPHNYEERAERLMKKEKYERALKFYNRAVKQNQYDHHLYVSRAKVKKILNDIEGSQADIQKSIVVKNEIITYINIIAVSSSEIIVI